MAAALTAAAVLLAASITVSQPAFATGTVTSAPVPAGAPASSDFAVTAAGTSVGIHDAGANAWGNHVGFGTFDMSGGPVTVTVSVGFSFSTAKIVPASLGLTATKSGSTVTFTLANPSNASLVFDGNYQGRTLHLFAQAPETNVPSPLDPNVIYFGPGLHTYTGNAIEPANGQTIYLAPGAVLRGRIRVDNKSNVTVRGRGVLLSDFTPTGPADNVAIAVAHSQNVTITGITTNRAIAGWTGFITESSYVTVSDYHVVSPFYASTDGFDINNNQHIVFDRVFIRSCDDAVSIKGYQPAGGWNRLFNPANATPNSDIVYKNSQLWADANNAIVVGEETIAASYSGIRFQNIDILYNYDDRDHPDQLTDRAALTVLMLNATDISDVVFDNIRVENAKRLINVDIRNSYWFGSLLGNLGWAGSIHGITFSNITSTSPGSNEIRMFGWDGDRKIDNVTLQNVSINGAYVTSAADSHLKLNSLATNVHIVSPSGSVTTNGPIGVTQAEDWTANRYNAEHDYTPQQPNRGWNYRSWKAGVGTSTMTWNVTEGRWRGTASWDSIWVNGGYTLMHPDGNQILLEWTAPRAGTIDITGTVRKWDVGGGDGVTASIWKNSTSNFWPGGGAWKVIAATDSVGYSTNATVTVAAGDVISFRVDGRATTNNDSTMWTPTITYR